MLTLSLIGIVIYSDSPNTASVGASSQEGRIERRSSHIHRLGVFLVILSSKQPITALVALFIVGVTQCVTSVFHFLGVCLFVSESSKFYETDLYHPISTV